MDPNTLIDYLTQIASALGMHGAAGWFAANAVYVLIAAAILGYIADTLMGALQNRSAFSLRELFRGVRTKLATKEGLACLGLLQVYAIAVQTNGFHSSPAAAALHAFALAFFGVSVAWWADARLKALAMLASAEARLVAAPQH